MRRSGRFGFRLLGGLRGEHISCVGGHIRVVGFEEV